MLLAESNGLLVLAQPGSPGVCPGCHEPVIAKCGEIVTWHWAHAPGTLSACDQWTEPETDWHLGWKAAALEAGCRVEVTMRDGDEWHRADILRPDGVIVEVQHSSLGIGEAGERENFYRSHGGLIWVWDARERYWPSVERWDDRYTWRQPSQTIASLRAPLYWDTEDGLRRITEMSMRWGELGFSAWPVESADEIFRPDESDVRPTLEAAALLPAKEAWTVLPLRCATCRAAPIDKYRDGSPRYNCGPHAPIYPAVPA